MIKLLTVSDLTNDAMSSLVDKSLYLSMHRVSPQVWNWNLCKPFFPGSFLFAFSIKRHPAEFCHLAKFCTIKRPL
jgi:hypothetical protein